MVTPKIIIDIFKETVNLRLKQNLFFPTKHSSLDKIPIQWVLLQANHKVKKEKKKIQALTENS